MKKSITVNYMQIIRNTLLSFVIQNMLVVWTSWCLAMVSLFCAIVVGIK